MVNIKPDVNPAGLYKGVEVCRLLDISKATLNRMVHQDKISRIIRKSTNERLYRGLEILRVWEEPLKV